MASLAARDLLRGPRRPGKVLAVLPQAIYLEFADAVPEPRVIAISPPDAIRLPNAIMTGLWETRPSVSSAQCWAGGDRVMACGLDIRIVRWWDPSPVFGPLSRARLDHGYGVLARLCAAAEQAPGLAGHPGPAQLAACCANGNLAGAVPACASRRRSCDRLSPAVPSIPARRKLRRSGRSVLRKSSQPTRASPRWLIAKSPCPAGNREDRCSAGGRLILIGAW